jgi:hypothetical protein
MSTWPDPAEMSDEELIAQHHGFVDLIRRVDETIDWQIEEYRRNRDDYNSERMRCRREIAARGLGFSLMEEL